MARIDFENLVRWTARVWSVASLLFLSAFLFGDAEQSGNSPTAVEWIGLAFFPVGVIAGLLVGWWRELAGGGLTVVSLVGFYVWHYVVSGRVAAGTWVVLLAAPGAFFLIAGCLQRRKRMRGPNSPRHSSQAFRHV